MREGVSKYASEILYRIDRLRETSSGKAILARVRNSVGRNIGEMIDILPILFESLPEECLGKRNNPSPEEIVLINIIQLYAFHQQGNVESVLYKRSDESPRGFNLGSALKVLRQEGDSAAVDRRFSTMITSTTFEELSYHLRQMLQLLKSKAKNQRVDYIGLTDDLFWFYKGFQDDIKLNWSREYYKIYFKGEEENEQ